MAARLTAAGPCSGTRHVSIPIRCGLNPVYQWSRRLRDHERGGHPPARDRRRRPTRAGGSDTRRRQPRRLRGRERGRGAALRSSASRLAALRPAPSLGSIAMFRGSKGHDHLSTPSRACTRGGRDAAPALVGATAAGASGRRASRASARSGRSGDLHGLSNRRAPRCSRPWIASYRPPRAPRASPSRCSSAAATGVPGGEPDRRHPRGWWRTGSPGSSCRPGSAAAPRGGDRDDAVGSRRRRGACPRGAQALRRSASHTATDRPSCSRSTTELLGARAAEWRSRRAGASACSTSSPIAGGPGARDPVIRLVAAGLEARGHHVQLAPGARRPLRGQGA